MLLKNKILILIPFLLVTIMFSCDKEDSFDEFDKSDISNCCKENALIEIFPSGLDSLPEATIYIPNIFTPNGDGINDEFSIFGQFEKINSLVVRFQWTTVFEAFDFTPNGFSRSWDGSFQTAGNITRRANRIYDYEITVTTLGGLERSFTGQVATLVDCISEAPLPPHRNLANCKFPSQHNGAGGHNPNASSLEETFLDDCFN